MEIIRLDEIDENEITKVITPTDEYAEVEAEGGLITVRKFLVQESSEAEPEEAIGFNYANAAKLLGCV